jgi:hypothetical protein
MPRDIRDILKEDNRNFIKLSDKHREKFEDKLLKKHTPKKRSYFFLKAAASIAVLVGFAYYFITNNGSVDETIPSTEITNLGSVSPEMKQIENYYLTAINYEMASLETTPESEEVLNTYLEKIALLTDKYKELTKELSNKGINEKTINALITNLQLRLQLLLELKDTISELKNPKHIENEKLTI